MPDLRAAFKSLFLYEHCATLCLQLAYTVHPPPLIVRVVGEYHGRSRLTRLFYTVRWNKVETRQGDWVKLTGSMGNLDTGKTLPYRHHRGTTIRVSLGAPPT